MRNRSIDPWEVGIKSLSSYVLSITPQIFTTFRGKGSIFLGGVERLNVMLII